MCLQSVQANYQITVGIYSYHRRVCSLTIFFMKLGAEGMMVEVVGDKEVDKEAGEEVDKEVDKLDNDMEVGRVLGKDE